MLTSDQLKDFNSNGYAVLKNLLSVEECAKLRAECEQIIESNKFMDEVSKIAVFSADQNETQSRDMYFLTSTDKIRPFLEAKAQQIIENSRDLQQDVKQNKQIFNKIGHALHALNPAFRSVTFSDKVKDVYKSLGYISPIVCQSMYIFKQPFIGGEVQVHQDGSYLHVDPLKIAGVWIALEDCDVENGCLQFLPGSNRMPLARRFIRNPDRKAFESGNYLIYTNEAPEYDEDKFVHVPIKAGDAIVIDGLVVHRSSPNFSPRSRHIYTFHVYEGHESTFSADNWMEYSATSFLPLYQTN